VIRQLITYDRLSLAKRAMRCFAAHEPQAAQAATKAAKP
jgi:hypothetical protein